MLASEGESLRGYHYLRELGKGGQSCVWLGVREQDGRIVAIKEVEGNPDASREGEILSRLSFPAIPRLYEQFSDGKKQYLVMEYMEGNNLRTFLSEWGPFSDREVLGLALQICDIFVYLHAQSPPVIYRDLKPGNLILNSSGVLSLIDFGSARLFDPEKKEDTVYLGTRGYAAPEQYGSMGQSDERTDLYAFGMTLYQLWTGNSPPEYSEMRKEPLDLPGKPFSNLILACIQSDPEKRPCSFRKVRRELRELEREIHFSETDFLKHLLLDRIVFVRNNFARNSFLKNSLIRKESGKKGLGRICCMTGLCLLVLGGGRLYESRSVSWERLADRVSSLVICDAEALFAQEISLSEVEQLLEHMKEKIDIEEKKCCRTDVEEGHGENDQELLLKLERAGRIAEAAGRNATNQRE